MAEDRRDKLNNLTARSQATPTEEASAAAVRDATPSPARSSASDTVTVACKLPNGLILKLYEMVERPESGPLHTRTVKVAQQVGEPVTIRGPAVPFGVQPSFQVFGGYALTPDVPREFFERWLDQNRDADYVRNNLVFAHVDHGRVSDRARGMADQRSGLEPLDPSKPPPGFRSGPNGGIERFDRNAA